MMRKEPDPAGIHDVLNKLQLIFYPAAYMYVVVDISSGCIHEIAGEVGDQCGGLPLFWSSEQD